MKFERFEDIVAWQKSKKLTITVYKLFEKSQDYSFRDQIQRASISVMNNIAEGYERKSNKEFQKFLFIAKGSVGEVRSTLYIAIELGYIKHSDYEHLHELSLEIAKIISGLIKS